MSHGNLSVHGAPWCRDRRRAARATEGARRPGAARAMSYTGHRRGWEMLTGSISSGPSFQADETNGPTWYTSIS